MENNIVIKIPNGSNSAVEGGEAAGSKMRKIIRRLRQSGSQGGQGKARVGPGLEDLTADQEGEAELEPGDNRTVRSGLRSGLRSVLWCDSFWRGVVWSGLVWAK